MNEAVQLATSFITLFGSYCYVTMPFGFRNEGVTYQYCMQKCFNYLIGDIVEAYVDNIVVKSKRTDHLIADLECSFKKLCKNSIKLNPEKCVFGVPKGMILGFIVSMHGIEANPEKFSPSN